jgi:hypothetical protein
MLVIDATSALGGHRHSGISIGHHGLVLLDLS